MPRRQFEDASTALPFSMRSDEHVFSSRAIALADCNGDARLDIVALGEGPRLGAMTQADGVSGDGARRASCRHADGAWTAKRDEGSVGLFGGPVATGDIDGDGRLDLAIASGTLGDSRLWYRGGEGCTWTAEAVDAMRPRSYITSIAVADVDGDQQRRHARRNHRRLHRVRDGAADVRRRRAGAHA